MGHALRRTRGVLPDRIHPGYRKLSVPERGGPRRKTQHRPLLGHGLPPWSRACRALTLVWEEQ